MSSAPVLSWTPIISMICGLLSSPCDIELTVLTHGMSLPTDTIVELCIRGHALKEAGYPEIGSDDWAAILEEQEEQEEQEQEEQEEDLDL